MRIINIDIEGLEYDTALGQFEGHVSLMIAVPDKARTVELHFVSRVAHEPDCPGSILTCSLIADALRQARRMPGFRRGEEDFEIVAPAPELTAHELTAPVRRAAGGAGLRASA